MAYPIGGRLIVGYASAGREFELALSLSPFNPTTFAYTAGGFSMPTEADVGQTFLALAAVMAPYYDASWIFSIKSVWQRTGTDAVMLPSVPSVGTVLGTSMTATVTDPALMRGFTFISALGNRQRVRLFLVESNEAGDRRTVTATMGGFDERDRGLVAYLGSPVTGARCWDGVPFPGNASVYVRSMRPEQGAVVTGGLTEPSNMTIPIAPEPAAVAVCVQMRCGIAAACARHLNALYKNWAAWLDPCASALADALVLAVVLDPIGDMIAAGVLAWDAAIFAAIKPLILDLVGTVTGALFPALDSFMLADIQRALFCQLVCHGDSVTVDRTATSAWQGACNSLTTWPNPLAASLVNILLEYTPLADWQAAARGAEPSSVCDAWVCP